jgi:hypothetical protein
MVFLFLFLPFGSVPGEGLRKRAHGASGLWGLQYHTVEEAEVTPFFAL